MKKVFLCDGFESMHQEFFEILKNKNIATEQIVDVNDILSKLSVEGEYVIILDYSKISEKRNKILQILKKKVNYLSILGTGLDRLQERAIKLLKDKIVDVIVYPFNEEEIAGTILEEYRQFKDRNSQSGKPSVIKKNRFRSKYGNMIGQSQAMQEIYRVIDSVADKDISVLIGGESGTGKELVAHAIHLNSHRKTGPFVKINCAAIPDQLIESELFGHEKGSFTGAVTRKIGKFEMAQSGTIFLDEIGDMSPAAQSKVLRVIQEKELERVGGKDIVKVDVRVIAATHRDLIVEVEAGRFREDLFYRLNVVSVFIPPLRDRNEDIPLLTDHFLSRFNEKFKKSISGFRSEVYEKMLNYSWPGNIRELQNVMESAVAMEGESMVSLKSLPYQLHNHPEKNQELEVEFKQSVFPTQREDTKEFLFRFIEQGVSLEELERRYIIAALRKTCNNQKQAALLLGMGKGKIQYRIKKLGICAEDVFDF